MYSWTINYGTNQEWKNNAVIILPNQGEEFQSHGNKLTVIVPSTVTDNQFGLYNIEMEPNARGPKLHYHKQMDETFIVREGVLTVLTSKGEVKAEPGTVIYIPKLSVHGYNNDSDNKVKLTMIFNPGLYREDFFRKMYQMLDDDPTNLEAFQQLYKEHDSYPVDNTDMIPMQR